jgi:hypothetical protein
MIQENVDVVIMQIEDGNLRIIQRYERQRKLNVDIAGKPRSATKTMSCPI